MNELEQRIKVLIEYAKNHNIDIVIAASNSKKIYTAFDGNDLTLKGLILTLMQDQTIESTETTRN